MWREWKWWQVNGSSTIALKKDLATFWLQPFGCRWLVGLVSLDNTPLRDFPCDFSASKVELLGISSSWCKAPRFGEDVYGLLGGIGWGFVVPSSASSLAAQSATACSTDGGHIAGRRGPETTNGIGLAAESWQNQDSLVIVIPWRVERPSWPYMCFSARRLRRLSLRLIFSKQIGHFNQLYSVQYAVLLSEDEWNVFHLARDQILQKLKIIILFSVFLKTHPIARWPPFSCFSSCQPLPKDPYHQKKWHLKRCPLLVRLWKFVKRMFQRWTPGFLSCITHLCVLPMLQERSDLQLLPSNVGGPGSHSVTATKLCAWQSQVPFQARIRWISKNC